MLLHGNNGNIGGVAWRITPPKLTSIAQRLEHERDMHIIDSNSAAGLGCVAVWSPPRWTQHNMHTAA